jgi:nucleoside-diphosphate-sugar epimerase
MNDTVSAPHTPVSPKHKGKKLLCFGYGYTAHLLAEALKPYDWDIIGTTTDPDKKKQLRTQGINSLVFDSDHALTDPYTTLADVTHILVSVPPSARGDVVCDLHGEDIAQMKNLEWIGYLSSTGVYGNRDGQWVDETAMPAPTSRRGTLRYMAEQEWRNLFDEYHLPIHFFRMSGIYGPGRSALDSIRAGNSRRIDKPGHAFNRIHVDDIVQTLIASMNKPNPGTIYNLADDHPAPSHEVIAYACTLLGLDVPPLIPFEQVDMAPMVRSFYADNKRVKNTRIKEELGVTLLYPDYQSGLSACFEVEQELSEIIHNNLDNDDTSE